MLVNRRFIVLIFAFATVTPHCFADLKSWLPGKKKPAQATPMKSSLELLDTTQADLQKLRVIVAQALDTGKFPTKDVSKLIDNLKPQTAAIMESLDYADPKTKDQLKEKANIIKLMFQALLEETAVLDLWSRGYEAYELDLMDNFKRLPNKVITNKPDLKKLYEELNVPTQEGKKLSFNGIRGNYKKRFDDLQKKDPASFDNFYFRPYLRVLDYVFKTPYSKMQYDAYLAGKAVYDKKTNALKSNMKAIQKLFTEDLPQLGTLPIMIEAELAQ